MKASREVPRSSAASSISSLSARSLPRRLDGSDPIGAPRSRVYAQLRPLERHARLVEAPVLSFLEPTGRVNCRRPTATSLLASASMKRGRVGLAW